MTPSIMLQGTASDVGKSVLVAGLCRILAQDGYRCTPFKSQNMALNSGITPDGKEMGRAQIFQAEAAGIPPDVRMNPVLLKPTSDRRSQVVLMGEVACTMDAVAYHAYKPQLQARIFAVYRSLAQQHEVVVLEGAGSPAEINLRDRDIVNMGMAAMAQSPVVLVADIDRGGVFAAIYGTLALLLPDEKARVKGVIINKFRGDVALLQSGISQIEALTSVPVLGVLPWLDLQLEDEDGVALDGDKYRRMPARALDIAVVRVPHMANFSDFNPLIAQPDVRVRYVTQPEELLAADLVILPGSKNTLDDLHWLQQQGMAAALLAYHQQGGALLGICGGYQMLGERIVDGVESERAEMAGLGLLPVVTRFAPLKVTTQVRGQSVSVLPGLWSACASLPLSGYEIHMGTSQLQPGARAFACLTERAGQMRESSNVDGAVSADGTVLGTYLHDLFTNGVFTRVLLDSLRERKGLAPFAGETVDYATHKSQQFDRLAAAMREHLDMDAIYRIIGLEQ